MDLLALLFGMRMESKLYQDGGTFYIPISSGSPVHYRIVCPFWLPVRALSGPNPDYLGYWVQLPTHNQKCEKRPQKWKIKLIYNKAKLGGQLVHHPFPGRHWGTQMTEGAEQIQETSRVCVQGSEVLWCPHRESFQLLIGQDTCKR